MLIFLSRGKTGLSCLPCFLLRALLLSLIPRFYPASLVWPLSPYIKYDPVNLVLPFWSLGMCGGNSVTTQGVL